MLAAMWREGIGAEVSVPFPRLTYSDAMERYGTDKPDLRIPWELVDLTESLRDIGFSIFEKVAAAGGRVRGFVVPGGGTISRSRLEALNELAQKHGAAGMLWVKRGAEGWSGGPARFLKGEAGDRLASELGTAEGDLLALVAGADAETSPALDVLRRTIAAEVGAVDETANGWLWVTDFPLFEADAATGEARASHHPFTMPATASAAELLADPFSVRARAYDVVYNGWELCSGSIRCHDPALQEAILQVLGFSPEETRARFGFLLEAFRYGVPPHGGFAVGVDRVVTLMVGASSLREVIAFPKTTAARGLMEDAPTPLGEGELDAFGLRHRS
jgi:aspartyl-tRNA synthetase